MYEALYRKYRPRTFDEVVGQEHITETLKEQVRSDHLSHAYLFIGTRGTGKTTCARILAKAANCEHPVNGNPCNCCPSCLGIDDGSILDVTELDAASNNGVDDVRLLRDEAIYSPANAKKRVYIIDEVHMLSRAAFNALLKILEEPPEHLLFILATTELNKVLPTILSRCQRHSFHRLDPDTIAGRLNYVAEQEHIRLSSDAALLLARLADGGMRDGLSLLDQCASGSVIDTETVLNAMGLSGSLAISETVGFIRSGNVSAALELFSRLWKNGKDPSSFLQELSAFFRDALLLMLAPKGSAQLLSGSYSDDMLSGSGLPGDKLLACLDILMKYRQSLKDSPDPRLTCELCLMELCGVKSLPTSAAMPAVPVSAPAPPAAPAPVTEPYAQPAAPAQPEKVEAAAASAIDPIEKMTDEPVPSVAEPPASPPAVISSTAADLTPVPAVSNNDWTSLLESARPNIPLPTYRLISDPCQISGRVADGILELEVMPGFLLNMLNRPSEADVISRAFGMPVRVREKGSAPDLQSDGKLKKLDELKKFPNVSFVD